MGTTQILVNGDNFIIEISFMEKHRAKEIPDCRWSKAISNWYAPCGRLQAQHILNNFNSLEISTDAVNRIAKILEDATPKSEPFPSWFKFKNEPMSNQTEALNLAWGPKEFALFMDMGTGKTFTVINLACARAMTGEINALLVLCDSGVKPVWIDEMEDHSPIPFVIHIHEGGKPAFRKTQAFIDEPMDRLKVLVIGVEALSCGNANAEVFAYDFCEKHDVMCAIDESISIKSPPKWKLGKFVPNRTTKTWKMGELSKFRIIMTGTPETQGVEDLYAQFRFLNWEIIGIKNFTSFKKRYCLMGGFQGKKIVGYNNVDELMNTIRPYSYMVKIGDVMDMPEQIFEKRVVDPSPEQKRMLKDLGDPYDMTTQLDDKELIVETILERMIRYQQIVGGFFPYGVIDEKNRKGYEYTQIPGPNPKLLALQRLIEQTDNHRKIVVWARFIPEQEAIRDYLAKQFGDESVVIYEGKTTQEKRECIAKFRNDPEVRFFVSGGRGYKGLTLVESNFNIIYSNTFNYGDRKQLERRTWRKGQDKGVLYIDLVMNHKIDKQIVQALRRKQDMADWVDAQIMGE